METEILEQIVRWEIAQYAGGVMNGWGYMLSDEAAHVYGVADIGTFNKKRFVGLDLLVRIADQNVIIETDANSLPLVDAGVPRNQIVLAYAGEPVPETAMTMHATTIE